MSIPVLLALAGTGCGGDGKTWGPNKDGVPPKFEEGESDTFHMGQLVVGELNQVTGQDPGHSTLVQAHFSDFSFYRVAVADRLVFSEACHIITSQHEMIKYCQPEAACAADADCPADHVCLEQSCVAEPALCTSQEDCLGEQACSDYGLPDSGVCTCANDNDCPDGFLCLESQSLPLHVEQVVFRGLAGGELVMTPDADSGRIPTEVLGGRAFEADTVSVEVSSGGGERDFPAFNEELPAPEFPVLDRVGDARGIDLAAGASVGIHAQRDKPFVVTWEPGDGDFVEFKIMPGAGSQTRHMKLRCITYDDGGLEVPNEAISHMSLDQATNFQVKIERHNFVLYTDEEGDVIRAAAQFDVNSALEGTVRR